MSPLSKLAAVAVCAIAASAQDPPFPPENLLVRFSPSPSVPSWVSQIAPDTILLGRYLRMQAHPGTSGTVDVSIKCGTEPCPQEGDLITATDMFGPELATNYANSDLVTVGLQWISNRAGIVRGIRFQKLPTDPGPHTVLLYDDQGVALAQADSVSETADGWQQARFDAPVAVVAGQGYVAAVRFTAGFRWDLSYFANGPIYRYPLKAITGVSSAGYNFPDTKYQDANYWVDVIFAATQVDPVTGGIPDTGVANINLRIDGEQSMVTFDDCAGGSPNEYSACHGGWGITIAQLPAPGDYSVAVVDGRFVIR